MSLTTTWRCVKPNGSAVETKQLTLQVPFTAGGFLKKRLKWLNYRDIARFYLDVEIETRRGPEN